MDAAIHWREFKDREMDAKTLGEDLKIVKWMPRLLAPI